MAVSFIGGENLVTRKKNTDLPQDTHHVVSKTFYMKLFHNYIKLQ